MKAPLKCLFVIALAGVLLIAGGHLYYRTTGDFNKSYLLKAKEAEVGATFDVPPEVVELLTQPFYYLGQGHQTFAFVSADDKIVLKLFKKDYLKRSGWQNIFPPVHPFRPFLLHQGKSKETRTKKLLNGYQMAYLHDKENSGLIYYHPEKTIDPALHVTLNTMFGFKKELDLNSEVFAIQMKAVTTKKELTDLLTNGNVSKAKERVRELFTLYFSSYRNGIFDHDHNLLDNTGFYESRAIRQDVGKIVYDPEMIDKAFVAADLKKIQEERLGPWFTKHFPRQAEGMIQTMNKEVEQGLSSFP